MYKSFFSFPRDQVDPLNMLDQSVQSEMDFTLELFTREVLAEDDPCTNTVTATLSEESCAPPTPPLVELSDEPEFSTHPVVELSDDPESSTDQVVVLTDDQESPAAPPTSTTPAPPTPPTPPSEPKIKAVCTFVTVDLRERGPPGTKEETKEEYDTVQKDNRAKAKVKG